jgi:hypothetical protein
MGVYRNPVRSSHGHFVKTYGLRWISLLPFLSTLVPSKRYCRDRGRRHKKLPDWARQLVLQARRWLPERDIVLVGDSGFAALELLTAPIQHSITGITCLRLDAVLYDLAPPWLSGTKGRPRTKRARRPNLSEVPASADTCWQRVVVPGWYGEGKRHVEICSATAASLHGEMPIRWVLVRDPHRRFGPQACCALILVGRSSRSSVGSSSGGNWR